MKNNSRLDALNLLIQGSLAFQRAENYGFLINEKYCIEQKEVLTDKINNLEKEFKQSNFYKQWSHAFHGKVNINSNAQLAAFIYKVKKIPPKVFTATSTEQNPKGATDEDALTQLRIPEISILLQMRKLKKLRDTYLDAYLREAVDGIIHPFYNLNNVASYRSSSDSPNWQNIPKRDEESMLTIRRGIIPRKGHQLLEADWSGAEVRTGCAYHKDPQMIKYVTDPTTDMHRDMATQIFLVKSFNKKIEGHAILRQAAKNGFVFPQFYGDWYKSCATYMACEWCKLSEGKWKPGQGIKFEDSYISDHLIKNGICSLTDFEDHLQKIEKDFWQRRFRVYNKWRDSIWAEYQKQGYFDTLTGFRCSGLMNKKQVTNFGIQGSSFHTLLWSFIRLDKLFRKEKLRSHLLGQIHDSIIVDVVPSELDYVTKTIHKVATVEMPRHYTWWNVPMELEFEITPISAAWSEKREFHI
jgi:DNA polymerase I-like protein with 3'-5' exonuclease and polymerase domains